MKSVRSKISFIALVLLIISAIDSNRNLPSSALFGSSLIFFFIFAAFFFLFPSALVSAELSATFPETGGIYHWIQAAFGSNVGMLAVWLQWINTLVWYPTILSFIAGTLTYLFDPTLMENKKYMITVISGIFWLLTIINLFGISVSSKINTLFASIGTIFPMLLLILLGIIWVMMDQPIQIPITWESTFPSLTSFSNWTALVAVMGSFLGMELSGVHVNNVPHPRKTFPRALFLSSMYILATMLFGSLAIAIVLPRSEINLAGGLMQVFDHFFGVFNLSTFVPIMSFMIVIGSIGGMINWLISPAKGLLQASQYGFLPAFFQKENSKGVAGRILIVQAILVTIFSSALFLLPTVNAFYWFLTALSNCLYMSMYILMFLAVFRLRSRKLSKNFQIPGGYFGLGLVCLLGITGAILTILFGFVPPSHVQVGSSLRYVLMVGCGNIILFLPVIFFIIYKRKVKKKV